MVPNTPNDDCNNIKTLLSGWGLSLTGRSCDNCRIAAALLYCKADTAFLCGPCDTVVHQSTTYPRHERVWVCEVCEQAPAILTCKADAAALCSTCDHDIHSANPLASRHERIPITPFTESPTTTAAASSTYLVPDSAPTPDPDGWLIPNPSSDFLYNDSDILNYSGGYQNNNNNNSNSFPEFQQQEIKPKLPVENNNRCYAFADSVVPTQSHGNNNNNNNSSSNNFSAFNGSDTSSLFENCFNIDFSQPNKLHKKNNNQLFSSSFNYSVSSSDIGVVPDGNTTSMSSDVSYNFTKSTAGDGVSSGGGPVMDREARVLRYREKRKNRKFEKTIRYASRKAYAETRPRVKGRFAKRTDANETSEIDFIVDNGGYGVVPAF